MRAFAQKRQQLQKPVSAGFARPNIATRTPACGGHPILDLQRTVGNRAVLRMLQTDAEELEAGLTATTSHRLREGFNQLPGFFCGRSDTDEIADQ
jgi:hypothetical protein